MDERFVLSLAVLLLVVSLIQSLPNGAPAQACSDLRPGPPHGGVPQTTPSPYELDVDMFQDLSSNDGIAVPVTYSYNPGRTYDRKSEWKFRVNYKLVCISLKCTFFHM